MAQRNEDNRIKITHFINPHFFYFKWVKDEGYDEDFANLERKVENAAKDYIALGKAGTEKKFKMSQVVAAFVPNWHKYIRATIKKRENDDFYCIWAIDYGVPMFLHVNHIFHLPNSFSGIALKNKRIHKGGIENCLPAENVYNLPTNSSVKVKLTNWTPKAVELMQNILNLAVKIEYEHTELLAVHKKPHYFGRLMIQKKDGQMMNVVKCLLDMDCAVLTEGEFRHELDSIDSLSQSEFMTIDEKMLDVRLVVSPVVSVVHEHNDSDIYDDDDESINEEDFNQELTAEDNEFFNESASVFHPNMSKLKLNANHEPNIVTINEQNGSEPIQNVSNGSTTKSNETNSVKSAPKPKSENSQHKLENNSQKNDSMEKHPKDKESKRRNRRYNRGSKRRGQEAQKDQNTSVPNRSNQHPNQANTPKFMPQQGPPNAGKYPNNFLPPQQSHPHQQVHPQLKHSTNQNYRYQRDSLQPNYGCPEFLASLSKNSPFGPPQSQSLFGSPRPVVYDYMQTPPRLLDNRQYQHQFPSRPPLMGNAPANLPLQHLSASPMHSSNGPNRQNQTGRKYYANNRNTRVEVQHQRSNEKNDAKVNVKDEIVRGIDQSYDQSGESQTKDDMPSLHCNVKSKSTIKIKTESN